MLNPEITAKLAELAQRCPGEAPWQAQGYRVVRPSGDAELGNWMVADFRWQEEASYVASLHRSYPIFRDTITTQAARIAELENHIELMRLALAKREPEPFTFTTGGAHGPR